MSISMHGSQAASALVAIVTFDVIGAQHTRSDSTEGSQETLLALHRASDP